MVSSNFSHLFAFLLKSIYHFDIMLKMVKNSIQNKQKAGSGMISTKGRYALRVMIDLAEQNNEGYIPLGEIAARQHISGKYLEAVVKLLVTEGLLKGHRGKGGGYRLTRPTFEYSVGEIIELAEGSLATVACLKSGAEPCPKESSCKTLPMWKGFDQLVHDYFYGITLAQLVDGSLYNSPLIP